MSIDVIDLRDFYSQRLGIVARQLINRGIRERWPDAQGQRVLGVGYPTPYLGLFREDSERCIAFMPAAQGVLKWPTARPTLATLVDEFSMPLPDSAVDRVLLVHALEMSSDPVGLLREVWRVLAAGGRLLVVVPNRRGVWARMDSTPFGHGRPYSRSQIMQLLRETWFTPTGWDEALYVLELANPHAPYGLRGVGEPPTISVTPAIVAAVRAATGLALTRVPVRPEHLTGT